MLNFLKIWCDLIKPLSFISLFVAGFLLFSYSVRAQEKCAIKSFQSIQKAEGNYQEDIETFERWMSEALKKRTLEVIEGVRPQSANEEITIPVVVHIIHEGEPLGSGTNIPDGQVLSQIEVLNEDFRRLNADRVNTPDLFEPVAADIQVNFVLAVRDPEGLPTTGIVRTNGGRNVWQLTDNYNLKNLSYWPAEDYLNIWVADLNDNYLGYAQFPLSGLEGLESASDNGFTDGVIVDYRAFGSVAKFPDANLINDYSLGRTTTHEVGHFLGLRHIWGDGGCDVDDFCADTPLQGSPNTLIGSPCNFPGPNSCNSGAGDQPDMFQNYMDYTSDVCMNLFTLDQRSRMQVVLENSPRRVSLKDSPGKLPPVQYTRDVGIRKIASPSNFVCPDSFNPMVEVRNYGTDPVNSFTIIQEVNGMPQGTETFDIPLSPLEIAVVEMPSIQVEGDGEIRFILASVDGTADENVLNNEKAQEVQLSDEVSGPIGINFRSLPEDWIVNNPDGLFEWQITPANNGNSFNRALFLNFYEYENFGELDMFVSPVIDLTDAVTATLV
jgi:hypothetical protein